MSDQDSIVENSMSIREKIYEQVYAELHDFLATRIIDKLEDYIARLEPEVDKTSYLEILADEVACDLYHVYGKRLRKK